MKIYEIGRYYGVGPFRTDLLFVTESIKAVLERYRSHRVYPAANWVNELFIIAPIVWKGQRKIGSHNFSEPKVMDRLEALQREYPDVRLCSGTFARVQGQPCRQILWYQARRMPGGEVACLIGLEGDLPAIFKERQAVIAEWENPPDATPPEGQWCGFPVR